MNHILQGFARALLGIAYIFMGVARNSSRIAL
jgi:hypothetical protein